MTSRNWMPLTVAIAFVVAFLTATSSAWAVNCTNDSDCGGDTPACNFGVCAQCSPTNALACGSTGSRTPVCIDPYGICGCENDGQCGSTNSGYICTRPEPASGSPPYCKTGCGPTGSGRNGCPTGYTCSNVAGGVGQCTRGCLPLLNECPAAAPAHVCRALPLPTTCVECDNANNSQCAAKPSAPICDTTAGTCVQCNANSDCSGKPNGPICLGPGTPQRSCGCNADADCGVGRICDETIKACMTGCRLPGGGKCPPGSQCRVADGGGEACVPTDAGAEDAGNDASTDDSGIDGGTDDAGTRDGGNGDAGANEGDGTSLEGGGWSCSMSPVEDALPIGGLVALSGLAVLFTRRRSSKRR